jgi:hypothetical protein
MDPEQKPKRFGDRHQRFILAIAPTFGTKRSLNGVHFDERSSLIMRLPLDTGRAELRRFALRRLRKLLLRVLLAVMRAPLLTDP